MMVTTHIYKLYSIYRVQTYIFGQFLQDYAPFDVTPLTLNLGVEELSWGGARSRTIARSGSPCGGGQSSLVRTDITT